MLSSLRNLSRSILSPGACTLAVVTLFGMQGSVVADDRSPALRINAPIAAPIWRIDVDESETHLVSSSAAKAVTVWDLKNELEPAVHRVPLRDEERQRAHGVAISPDGDRIAYSVPPQRDTAGHPVVGTARIYIINRHDGALVRTIDGIPTRPQMLSFGPEGEQLAATLSDGFGVRLWSVTDGMLIFEDDDGYGGGDDGGERCATSAAERCDAFPDTPELIFVHHEEKKVWFITSGDTGIRTYGKIDGTIQRLNHATPQAAGLERPEGVAISPDAREILVGDRRIRGRDERIVLKLTRLDLATLRPTKPPLILPESAVVHPGYLDPKQVKGADQMSLNRVAWLNVQGKDVVLGGGTFWCVIAKTELIAGELQSPPLDICLVRWSWSSAGSDPEIAFVPVGIDRVMDLHVLKNYNAIAYATLRRIGVINTEGEPVPIEGEHALAMSSNLADFRSRSSGKGDNEWLGIDISDDAQTVYFEDYRSTGDNPVRLKFNLSTLALDLVGEQPANVKSANVDPFLVETFRGWRNGRRAPKIFDMQFRDDDSKNDVFRAVALSTNERAVLGSSNFLRVVGYAGDRATLLCRVRTAAEVFRINVTPDGSLVVAGHSDGTLRWYRIASTGEGHSCRIDHVLSVHLRELDYGGWTWLAWRPTSGEFAAAATARDLVEWQVATEDGQVARVPFRKLKKLYNRRAVIASLKAPAVQKSATTTLAQEVRKAAEPVSMTVLSPQPLEGVDQARVRFDVLLDGQGKWPKNLLVRFGNGDIKAEKFAEGKRYGPNAPIVVKQPGLVSLDVVLPEQLRRVQRNIHVCLELDASRNCHTINWTGPVVPPRPLNERRLHAVIIGFSDYEHSDLDLPFAQNDALDIAKLFIDDFRSQRQNTSEGVKPDFSEISIDLVVAPTTAAAKDELSMLAKLPYVRVHPPTRNGILQALRRIAEADANEQLSDDLFLFFYSGHGLLHPFNKVNGRTAFLTPAVNPDYSAEDLKQNAFTSAELLELLEQISSEKLVMFDACRTTAGLANETPFDPGNVRSEFETRVRSAHFFFSGRAGQFSLDQNLYAFNSHRGEQARGNGLFTYAVLKSLTDKSADIGGSTLGRNKIEAWEVRRYVDGFFDPNDSESAAQKLIVLLKAQGRNVSLQTPVYVPPDRHALGRAQSATSTIIRSLP